MKRRVLLSWLGSLLTAIVGLNRATPAGAQSNDAPTLPYPHVTVPGASALAEWERLRAEGRGWPVIVGDDEQLEAIAEQFSLEDEPITPAEILAEAETLSFPESLAEWSGTDPDLPEPPLGEWPAPGTVQGAGLSVASDVLSGKPLPLVHILLIPTTRSWEVPAFLRWGDWNASPPPALHVAVLKDWHERFGVELVAINQSTLNLRTVRRPADRETALALAHEHYLYCPDVVDQGVGSLSALAALLMSDDWWYFWWD